MSEPVPDAGSRSTAPILRVLAGEALPRPPVWLMRQAGRYLPEYREIRAEAGSFLDLCYTPRLAVEVTLQPIRRFAFDAAILFSDILVVPDALGCPVSFETGHGPRLQPVTDEAGFSGLRETLDMDRLAPVFETVSGVKARLPREVALLGFCGAPFTVASYMIAGQGTPDQGPARRFAYRHPALFDRLVGRLVDVSITYLCAQVEAGADAVQIFDSWAGVLPAEEYRRWSLAPITRIVEGVRARHPRVPIIGFPRVSGGQLIEASTSGVTALGLDTVVDPGWAHRELAPALPLQGNLDPMVLVAGGGALDAAVDGILGALAGRPHIFNLGHGITPETPIENVERMLARLRR